MKCWPTLRPFVLFKAFTEWRQITSERRTCLLLKTLLISTEKWQSMGLKFAMTWVEIGTWVWRTKSSFFFQFQLGFLNTFRAWGIYLGASVVDHSCCPNANVVFDGRHIVIRSLKEFDSHDCGCDFSGNYLDMGKEVQITYIDVMEHTSVRIKKLQEQYYFTCECPRCLGIQLTWNSKLVHLILNRFQ